MSSNKLTPENKTSLTEAQEDQLIKDWMNGFASVTESHKDAIIAFGRLYHTEATKQTPKIEGVKSAEEVLKKHTTISTYGGANGCLVDAMHEYAAQFQQGWRPIEDMEYVDYPYVIGGYNNEQWTHEAVIRDEKSRAYFLAYKKFSTHYFLLPTPPNDQP